jgi:uncharacterized membrane protein YphA (DoxX/SURF4 family)
MEHLTEWLRLNFRICLSATLMIEAVIGLIPSLDTENIPSVISGLDGLPFHSLGLSFLYFLTSIWVILGIKTHVVAALGACLLIIPTVVMYPEGNPELAMKLTLVAVFCVPLIVFGGGRFTVLDSKPT